MSTEQLGYISNVMLVSATVVYVLAMVAYVAEWANSRRVVSVAAEHAAEDEVKQRALVGVSGDSSRDAAGTTQQRMDADELRTEQLGRIGVSLTVLAFALHVASALARGLAAGRVPWGNMFEFTVVGALAVAGAYLVALRLYRVRWLGVLLTAFVVVVLGLAMLTPVYAPPGPLVPALHSYWLVIHVAAAALAGGAFCLGALASVLFLVKSRAERRTPQEQARSMWSRLPSAREIDRIAYKVHAFAFPVWTFGALIAGPIWAYYAWSRFWGWDPKEVWALITWVVYAAYLHARATAGWQGRKAAAIALVGFAAFLFNFIGINLFGSGLHSYAGL